MNNELVVQPCKMRSDEHIVVSQQYFPSHWNFVVDRVQLYAPEYNRSSAFRGVHITWVTCYMEFVLQDLLNYSKQQGTGIYLGIL